jgi:mannose 2-epimerase
MNDKNIVHKLQSYKEEWNNHINNELLPFWFERAMDKERGGFITQFDRNGNDAGTDEKSLIAQARMTYAMSAAARAGYQIERTLEFAHHGAKYLITRMWDNSYGGFFWMTDRNGKVTVDKKIVYGQSFGIYALSEYYLATNDKLALEFAKKAFELLLSNAADIRYGGFFEMFSKDWVLAGPGSAGGDRKTLDVHMHLMEAFTTLYKAANLDSVRRRLEEVVSLLANVIYSPRTGAGKPQFSEDWKPTKQIKFDIIWGWDRFQGEGVKANADDNFSYGHDMEFFWLLLEALRVLNADAGKYKKILKAIAGHVLTYGIDHEYGGVYVEGPLDGPAHDLQKEFWQQAESLIGLLDCYMLFKDGSFLQAYDAVHRFVFEKMIAHDVGEWLPLLERDGKPIWTHMGTSWKINYHTLRCAIMCVKRIDALIGMKLSSK